MSNSRGEGAEIDRFKRARRDHSLAVVEGFHAIKHALRFDAEIDAVLCADRNELKALCEDLAPDVGERLLEIATPLHRDAFERLLPRAGRTGVAAIAIRRDDDERIVLEDPSPAPLVLLDEPRDMGNVGACIRVAAAAQAAGVIVTGRHDPWHADSIRGSAGLHFALPVLWAKDLRSTSRPLIAMDPRGKPLRVAAVPPRAMLAFGSERRGLSHAVLERASETLAIPMREGVSSLNLATSVSAVLFAARLRG